MKYFKCLLLIFLTFPISVSFVLASEPEMVCRPILLDHCKGNICTDVSSSIFLEELYKKCANSVKDLESLQNGTNVSSISLSSDIGYIISFSNLISRALLGKSGLNNFESIKQDYIGMKKIYQQYLKSNQFSFLNSLHFLDETEKNKKSKEFFLNEIKVNTQKINEKIVRLEMMLESPSSLKLYSQTHKELVPAIMFESNTEKFKSKNFSDYECSFLDINFNQSDIKELKERLAYTCDNK